MRLLIVSGAFPPMASGEATNTYFLGRNLTEKGVDVHVLTSAEASAGDGGSVAVYPFMRSWSWREVPTIVSVLRRVKPDAVLLIYLGGIYNYHPMITFLPTICRICVPGTRFVTRFENVFGASEPSSTSLSARVIRKLAQILAGPRTTHYNFGTLLRDSAHLIALCDYHMTRLREYAGEADPVVSVIPPPPNIAVRRDPTGALRSLGRARMGARPEDFVVGYMGYVYPRKGVDTLLKAFRLLRESQPGARLLVLGGNVEVPSLDSSSEGYFERMQLLAEQLGIGASVSWAGAFNALDPDVASYIHAPDVFVLPFDRGVRLNNSSYSSLVSYGVPVIATRGPDVDKELLESEGILLLPPENPDELARALAAVHVDHDLRRRLRQCSEQMARTYFSWDTALTRTLSVLGLPVGQSASGS